MKSEKILRRLAKPMLLATAILWGMSFMMMKTSTDSIPPMYLGALRLTGGAIVVALLFIKRWKTCTFDYIWRGAVIGFVLFLAYAFQLTGVMYTTPSKTGFLTATYCVMVPFMNWLITKHRPDRYNILASLLCIGGVGLVALTGSLSIAKGDILMLVCAVFFGLHIITVGLLGGDQRDPFLMTALQFTFAAIFFWIAGFFTAPFPSADVFTGDMIFTILYLSVIATAACHTFQSVGQMYADPSSAAVLLSLESVFGVLFSVLFYGDPMTVRLAIGFIMIILAVLSSVTKFSFLRRKKDAAAIPTSPQPDAPDTDGQAK